jgi:hypothetical protein
MEERTKSPSTAGQCSEAPPLNPPDNSTQTKKPRNTLLACTLACPWTIRVLFLVIFALTALYAVSEHRKLGTPSAALARASSRFDIYIIAQGLQEYRDSTGAFPATLEEADLDEEGIEYVTSGASYRLIAVEDSTSLVYTEGADLSRIEAAFKVLEGSAVR